MVSVDGRIEAAQRAPARGAAQLEAAKPRSDIGTIFIHWVAVLAAVVSLLTGLRIAADASGAVIAPLFEAILPNGEVWTFHVFAGLILFFSISAYTVYIYRAALARRNSPKRMKALTMPAPKRVRWQAINVLLHWLAYVVIVVLTATGGRALPRLRRLDRPRPQGLRA
jgi:cytochrome b subunit of formate dehydrogenase